MEINEPKPVDQTPTSSPSKADRDTTIEALNHLIQGKRHLLVQDIPSAVTSLQEACQLLAACYGEVANECGEAYFYYGKALLEMAREENSILGNAIGEERDTDDDDDDDDDEEDEEEEEDNDADEKSDETKTTSDEVEKDDKETEKKKDGDENAKSVEGVVEGQAGPSSVVPDSSKKEEEEDVTNLQLAWEMLELSKLIFSRQSEGNREKQLRLAEVHLYLGEVSLESENYQQAIEEFNRCLSIQRELLQPEDRLLAETHYQLGLACSFNNMFDESIGNFKEACRIIEEKITVLSVTAAGPEMEKEPDIMAAGDPVAIAKREIEELREILPEIREKITDTEESKKNAIESVRNAALLSSSLLSDAFNAPQTSTSGPENSVASSSSETSTSKPILNIGHLVKRKRKPENDCEPEPEQKRTCSSPTEQQKQQQPSSSDVSSSTESTTTVSSATATNVAESMEATSSTVNYRENRTVSNDDVDCLVTSATKCNSEEAKIPENSGHCDSVYNGDSRDTNAISSHPIPDLPQINEIAVEATNV